MLQLPNSQTSPCFGLSTSQHHQIRCGHVHPSSVPRIVWTRTVRVCVPYPSLSCSYWLWRYKYPISSSGAQSEGRNQFIIFIHFSSVYMHILMHTNMLGNECGVKITGLMALLAHRQKPHQTWGATGFHSRNMCRNLHFIFTCMLFPANWQYNTL